MLRCAPITDFLVDDMNTRMIRGLGAGLALAFSVAVHAAPYSGLVVFGDSLSDSGNNAAAGLYDPTQVVSSNAYIPSFTYASGTYSNGPVWASTLASMIGLPGGSMPSLLGGSNYAFGGATTGPAGSSFPFSLTDQVSSYLFATGGVAPSDALYVIAGGGNNARAALTALMLGAPPGPTIAAAASAFAADVGGMVDALQAAGAKRIVVWNTPNLGLAPAVTAAGALASATGSAVASSMNAALAARLLGETDVLTFDLFGLLGEIAIDPSLFGLTNISDACGAVAGCDPSKYLFWDGIHPTSGGHALLAQAMFSAVPEPAALWLVLAAMVMVAMQRRRRA